MFFKLVRNFLYSNRLVLYTVLYKHQIGTQCFTEQQVGTQCFTDQQIDTQRFTEQLVVTYV
jgi:hypothetical protein